MKKIIPLIFSLLLLLTTAYSQKTRSNLTNNTEHKVKETSNIQTQALDKRKDNFSKKADEKTKIIYQRGLDAITESDILATAKNIGDIAPNFILKNALGKEVSLQKHLENGPVVLVWYRGGWCPYCNINLRFLQEELPNIKAQGATLLALTPELPDQSINTAEKHQLDFEILSDIHNKVAKDYGVVFKLTDEVAKIYNEKFGLNNYNGDKSNELPLAVTYIINTDGKIVYAFLDADYRKRAEPSDITNFLKNMKN